jgi:hypothetical protein
MSIFQERAAGKMRIGPRRCEVGFCEHAHDVAESEVGNAARVLAGQPCMPHQCSPGRSEWAAYELYVLQRIDGDL